jgi:hypothetical protein
MLSSLLAVLAVPAICVPDPASDSLVTLYQGGRRFAEFLDAAKAREDEWKGNYRWSRLEAGIADRARALVGVWRLLVVAVDSCGDSAHTMPYVATLADSSDGHIELRVVSSTEGRWVMEAHRTSDGRPATPTVILLDGNGQEAGCWVERPGQLAKWALEAKPRLPEKDFLDQKYAWYHEDRGRQTVGEVLEMIEHAGPGRPCGGGA